MGCIYPSCSKYIEKQLCWGSMAVRLENTSKARILKGHGLIHRTLNVQNKEMKTEAQKWHKYKDRLRWVA